MTKLIRTSQLKPGDKVAHCMGYEPKHLIVAKVETITYVTYNKKDSMPIKVAYSNPTDAVYVDD